MKKLIIANWKMNPGTEREAAALARASDAKGVVIAAPFPFLPTVRRAVKRASIGAQDVFWEKKGAYTGEVSPAMLVALGVSYVIIGHSERRRPPVGEGETDEIVNKKVKAALAAGLKVILCVGESLPVRKRGFAAAKNFVKRQLQLCLCGIGNWKLEIGNLVVAYEPIWAIGTGRAATPADAVAMAKYIKIFLRAKPYSLDTIVLYGGSVNAANAGPFLARRELGGALVGGASLKADEFHRIIRLASRR